MAKKRKRVTQAQIDALKGPEVLAREERAKRVYEEWREFDRRRRLRDEAADQAKS